jgi:hypothetical protein
VGIEIGLAPSKVLDGAVETMARRGFSLEARTENAVTFVRSAQPDACLGCFLPLMFLMPAISYMLAVSRKTQRVTLSAHPHKGGSRLVVGGEARAEESVDLMMPMCFLCAHFSKVDDRTCTAFPYGILTDILRNRFDHRYLHPNQDNETLFTPDRPDAQRYVEHMWSLAPGPVIDPPPDDAYV